MFDIQEQLYKMAAEVRSQLCSVGSRADGDPPQISAWWVQVHGSICTENRADAEALAAALNAALSSARLRLRKRRDTVHTTHGADAANRKAQLPASGALHPSRAPDGGTE